MTLDNIILLAAKARAAELISQIESGEISYEEIMNSLRGGT